MKLSRWLVLTVLALAACAGEPARPVRGHDKPQAPVSLKVDSVDRGGGLVEVSVVAVPSEALEKATLRLILPAGVTADEGDKPVEFGAVAAGKPLTLVRHLHVGVEGADVVADVRVDNGVSVRNRAQVFRAGKAKPPEEPRHYNTVTLPSGDKVEEVRQ
jgi:hypothetical protein